MQRIKKLSMLWEPFRHKRISLHAAGACYYLLLSSIPATVLLLTVTANIPYLVEILDKTFQNIFPSALYPLISAFCSHIQNSVSISILSVSIFTFIWSASKGIFSIRDGLNSAMGFVNAGNYVVRKILSVLYFILFSICVLFVVLVLVFANHLICYIGSALPSHSNIILGLLQFRGIISFVVLTTIFTLFLRLLPTCPLSGKACILGGVLTSLFWICLTFFFSLYVNNFSGYTHKFGGLGMVLLFMIWLKVCKIGRAHV